MAPRNEDEWPGWILSVKKPIQFFACSWITTVLLMGVVLRNESTVSTLGREGVLVLAAVLAAVLLAVLRTFVLWHRGEAGAFRADRLGAGDGEPHAAGEAREAPAEPAVR
jgi:hypothetical protein